MTTTIRCSSCYRLTHSKRWLWQKRCPTCSAALKSLTAPEPSSIWASVSPRNEAQAVFRERLDELQRQRDRDGILLLDDIGVDELKVAAHHLAALTGDWRHIVHLAAAWMPDLPYQMAKMLAHEVLRNPEPEKLWQQMKQPNLIKRPFDAVQYKSEGQTT